MVMPKGGVRSIRTTVVIGGDAVSIDHIQGMKVPHAVKFRKCIVQFARPFPTYVVDRPIVPTCDVRRSIVVGRGIHHDGETTDIVIGTSYRVDGGGGTMRTFAAARDVSTANVLHPVVPTTPLPDSNPSAAPPGGIGPYFPSISA